MSVSCKEKNKHILLKIKMYPICECFFYNLDLQNLQNWKCGNKKTTHKNKLSKVRFTNKWLIWAASLIDSFYWFESVWWILHWIKLTESTYDSLEVHET